MQRIYYPAFKTANTAANISFHQCHLRKGLQVVYMSNFTIYHNPRCSKSRQTLAILEKHNIQAEIVLYLENPPSKQELQTLLQQLGKNPRDILRKVEEAYKSKGLADTALSDDDLLNAMIAEPKLIERPIVVSGTSAVLGRPPENVLELIK